MRRIAAFIVDHSRAVLALTALVSLAAAAMLFRISFNADVAQFMTEGNERGEAYAALQEKYETDEPINILVSLREGGGSFSDGSNLADLARLRDELSAVAGVRAVAALIPEQDPATGVTVTPEALEATSMHAARLRSLLLDNPAADLLLSEDRRHTLIVVVPEGSGMRLAADLAELADTDLPGDFELTLTGNPVIYQRVLGLIGWFLLVIPPTVVVLLAATFYANIGDRKLTMLAIIPALLGSLWTFGLIFALGIRIDIVTVIVPIFVLVMGSADGLHFVTHFQEEVARTQDRVERVATTLGQIGTPMILTSVSTAAGFLSLLATDIHPMRQMGVFTAVGIGFAGVISFFSLPALLSRLSIRPLKRPPILGPRLTQGIKALASRRVTAVVLSMGLLAFAAALIPRLELETDQLFFFKDTDPIRTDFAKMQEVFGGATPLIGEFAFDPDPATAPRRLKDILGVSREMEDLPGVRRVFSAADVLAAVPPRQAPAMLAGLSEGAGSSPLGKMVSEDGLRFVLFPGHFSSADLRGWLDFADEHEEVRVLTGIPVLWDEMARLVLRAQVGSLAAAFVLVLLMLLVAYRRVGQTLAAMAPLALTVLTLLGFLATSGINLNLLTAIASSIVLGVGIDYAIHLIAAIDYARAAGDGYVLRAIDKAGRPIVANALGIAVGLSALWLSPLKFHSQVSMIMWVSMTTAALATLVVIPALYPRAGLVEGPARGPAPTP